MNKCVICVAILSVSLTTNLFLGWFTYQVLTGKFQMACYQDQADPVSLIQREAKLK